MSLNAMPATATQEAADRIEFALRLTTERLAEDPSYFVYRTAQQELSAMRANLQAAGQPDAELQKGLTIGWLAVRELDGSDPEYERALVSAAYAYRQLQPATG